MLALDIVLVLAIVIVLDIVRSYRALARGCACVRYRDRTQYHACTRVSLARARARARVDVLHFVRSATS